jgi:hypothetical protein
MILARRKRHRFLRPYVAARPLTASVALQTEEHFLLLRLLIFVLPESLALSQATARGVGLVPEKTEEPLLLAWPIKHSQ